MTQSCRTSELQQNCTIHQCLTYCLANKSDYPYAYSICHPACLNAFPRHGERLILVTKVTFILCLDGILIPTLGCNQLSENSKSFHCTVTFQYFTSQEVDDIITSTFTTTITSTIIIPSIATVFWNSLCFHLQKSFLGIRGISWCVP